MRLARGLLALSLVVGVLGAAPAASAATPLKLTPNGQAMFSYGSSVESFPPSGNNRGATCCKPESKLFYTGDGTTDPYRWWAVLGTSGPNPAAGVWLWRLDRTSSPHRWVSLLKIPGADPWEKADTLFDGSTLYIALRDNNTNNQKSVGNLYEVHYTGNGTWGTPRGPFPISGASVQALTIAKDGTGRIWAAFTNGLRPRVAYLPSGASCSPSCPAFTSVATPAATDISQNDLAAVTAFGGDKIGVLWSDQVAEEFEFAWRNDSDPIPSWHMETAFGGGVGGCPNPSGSLKCADNHLNIKYDPTSGDLYVAVKTGLNIKDPVRQGTDPLVALLRRDPSGNWTEYTISPVNQQTTTRPVVLLAPDLNLLWVFASRQKSTTKNDFEVDYWESSLSSPSFSPTGFQVWASSGQGAIDDATSTKQEVSAATGAVVEAELRKTTTYWHNEFKPPNAQPTADAVTVGVTTDTTNDAITLTGHDVESCELTFAKVTDPAHGTLGSVSDAPCTGTGPFSDTATIPYTPDPGYSGPDSFTYKVTDGDGLDSAAATVSITVSANTNPTAVAASATTTANNSTKVQLVGHDVEDCDLTFTPAATSANGATITGLTNKACTAGSPNTDAAAVTYAPPTSFTGTDTFTFTVTDSSSFTSTPATVTVKVKRGNACTISGTSGHNVLKGTSFADVLCGKGGRDRLIGGHGRDLLVGGPGRDKLNGGPGKDRCREADDRRISC